ncbi:MAG: phosphoribosylglycinamide formyltransferase [Verrucomicrobia bacterium]|nr:phosphoribosylglycinamide formyltransferase [Verrucomicrobiota bacterium]
MSPAASGGQRAAGNKLRLVILGSGSGTNCQVLLDACAQPGFPAQVAVVISDVEDAKILDRARKAGVEALYLPPGRFRTKLDPEAEQRYIAALRERGVGLVCLAGFMRIIKADFLNAFSGRVINIHPALLPAFPGLESWKQALDYGAKVAGCTVHFVDAGIDSGPIILQAAVPVLDNDTAQTLHARVQVEEHRIYPEAVRLIAEGRLRIEGRRVIRRE